MRRPLVAGNWKMNGSRVSITQLLVGMLSSRDLLTEVDVAVLAPTIYLPLVAGKLEVEPVAWGGQDLSEHENGPFTGETAGSMLKDYGCRYVAVGHSERRTLFGDTDRRVAAKVRRAVDEGLQPILCVGEQKSEREAGTTEEVVSRQLKVVIDECGVDVCDKLVVAYEPVWAIGTGLTATPEQAQAVHAFIRETIAKQSATIAASIRILYGGSVKPENAKALFEQPDIDGGLIGGASLKAEDFLAICRAART